MKIIFDDFCKVYFNEDYEYMVKWLNDNLINQPVYLISGEDKIYKKSYIVTKYDISYFSIKEIIITSRSGIAIATGLVYLNRIKLPEFKKFKKIKRVDIDPFNEENWGYHHENERNNITFKIIKDYELNQLIKEEYNYNFYERNNKEKLNLREGDLNRFIKIEEKINNYLNEINPFNGHFINKFNQNISYKYNISVTEHYITKYLRKEYEDPHGKIGIINPSLYEGIDLIYNNKNLMTKYINTLFIKEGERVNVKMMDRSKYSLIFVLDKKGKKEYEITLITQMKGLDFASKTTKTIRLHPSGNF